MRRNKNFPRKRHEILPLESDIKFIVSSCFGPNFGESCFHDISPLTNKNFLISDQNPRLKAIFSTIFFITVSTIWIPSETERVERTLLILTFTH